MKGLLASRSAGMEKMAAALASAAGATWSRTSSQIFAISGDAAGATVAVADVVSAPGSKATSAPPHSTFLLLHSHPVFELALRSEKSSLDDFVYGDDIDDDLKSLSVSLEDYSAFLLQPT